MSYFLLCFQVISPHEITGKVMAIFLLGYGFGVTVTIGIILHSGILKKEPEYRLCPNNPISHYSQIVIPDESSAWGKELPGIFFDKRHGVLVKMVLMNPSEIQEYE